MNLEELTKPLMMILKLKKPFDVHGLYKHIWLLLKASVRNQVMGYWGTLSP